MALRLTGEAYLEAGLHGNVSVSTNPNDVLEMMRNIDRPAKSTTEATFSYTNTYFGPEKIGFEHSAGLGRYSAQCSIVEAEAKGPSLSAGSVVSPTEYKTYFSAELASASASAGIVKAKVGVGVDTGIRVGLDGVQASVLGTGFSIGRRTSISLFGSGVELNFW